MPTKLGQFRNKLVERILHAEDEAIARRYIYAAVRGLERKSINGYIITRFMDAVSVQLASIPHSSLSYKQLNVVTISLQLLEQARIRICKPA